jgi:hypothetical protein
MPWGREEGENKWKERAMRRGADEKGSSLYRESYMATTLLLLITLLIILTTTKVIN